MKRQVCMVEKLYILFLRVFRFLGNKYSEEIRKHGKNVKS